ncbi:RAB14 [Cordylochernes scorpioides]|uniref:RAB14 n=1 Tax=Cordylochernes scorpioides TaxID=51811 RepID=A0ABY6KS63_9ARAC|nr:RAB14 [Cordylochernes scorpioides]
MQELDAIKNRTKNFPGENTFKVNTHNYRPLQGNECIWLLCRRHSKPSTFSTTRSRKAIRGLEDKQDRRRSTYNHLSSWLTDARNLTNPNTVIFLIGNKCDLDGQRDVTYEEAKQFAEENGLMFVEASAKTGENVEEAFLETAKKIYQNIQDGSLDLNAAESGVQHKPSAPRNMLTTDQQPSKDSCSC